MSENLNLKELETQGSILATELLPKDLCHFLTHYMLREAEVRLLSSEPFDDPQSPGALAIKHSVIFDTINERVWPFLENKLGIELIPTYSYARLYFNNCKLAPHTDREACEYSVTLQLGRSHHYAWPLHVTGKRYDLGEGDAVIYKGMDANHWRDRCDGPDHYFSGQVFLHYVAANGPHAQHAGDKRWEDKQIPFHRFRGTDMFMK